MAEVQLQELHGRVAAHNANKAMLIADPHWDKVTVFNTEVINSNLQALAHVLAPSLQLATCKPRFAQHAAAANDFIRTERVDFWYKGATENTEVINANLIALGQVMAPAVQLTAVVDNVAKYPSNVAGPRIEPGKQMWDKFTTSNTETINANLHALALAQAAASAEKWLVSCNVTEGLWIKSAAENSEIINANLLAFAQALTHVVVQVVPPPPDQTPPPTGCCLVM